MLNVILDEKESNELMGNHILRPIDVSQLFREDENLVVGMVLDNNKVCLILNPSLMILKYN